MIFICTPDNWIRGNPYLILLYSYFLFFLGQKYRYLIIQTMFRYVFGWIYDLCSLRSIIKLSLS